MKERQKDILILAILLIIIIATSMFITKIDLNSIRDFILSFGILSPLVYIFLMVLAIVISPIPSLPLDITSGALFGAFLGGFYSLIGGLIGATIAFYIARKAASPLAEESFPKFMRTCNKCNENYLTFLILISRLLPIFNFDIVSYAAGITKIRFWKFFLSTLIGMMPMTFLFSYLGESALKIIQAIPSYITIITTFILLSLVYLTPKIKNRMALKKRNTL